MPIEPPPTPWSFADPDPRADDLVGIGGDLAPGTVLAAYRRGLFPMHVEGELAWWSPVQRGVLELDGLKVSKSLRRACRDFEIRVDTAFDAVLAGCGDPSRTGAWINDEIRHAYTVLHRLGWAHSIEAWQDGQLAGGLYGLAVGGLFAGESMFHRVRDASKVALVGLVELLRDAGPQQRLIDVQWHTDHLGTLGVVEWPRARYLRELPGILSTPLPAIWGE